jgi:polyhydroxyalkanoate synthase
MDNHTDSPGSNSDAEHALAEGSARLVELQLQLATHWREVVHTAVERFSTRAGTSSVPYPSVDDLMKIYEVWIECAEQAYAEIVRKEEYCQMQAELVNAALRLLLQVRAWAEASARVRLTDFFQGGGSPWAELNSRTAEVLTKLHGAHGLPMGCTAKRAVWTGGKATLYRYCPLPFAPRARRRPVLICFALVNRPYILDLSPEQSLIRRLLATGLEVYLIDWGNPVAGDRCVGLDEYIEGHLDACVRYILETHGVDGLNLVGVCQGGTFSLCYAALHPASIANLVTITTPVDFHTPEDLLSRWVRNLDTELLLRAGNVPGWLPNLVFLSLSPFRLGNYKYVAFLARNPEQALIEQFVRIEQWIFDNPAQDAAALTQYVRWFYQENRLIKGSIVLGGRTVDLRQVVQPVLNIYAARDHLVPAGASAVMQQYIGSRDYTSRALDTGHVGIHVSQRWQRDVQAQIASWLLERD